MPKSEQKQTAHGNTGENGSVDKIRDLLFGSQMQDYEKRFNHLEEMLTAQITNLQNETRKWFDSLESFVKKELDSLSDRLSNEKTDRIAAVKELSQELKKTAETIQNKIDDVSEKTAANDKEVRRQILDQSKMLRGEALDNKKEISDALHKAEHQLREDKVDRTAFANMLSEMALRIKEEFVLPDVKNMKDE
ncbi:MAG: hypothetical protein JXB48_10460 [Candidatus Latescibacteria bacterium]|nr:hypothetical protein [Candidatus Latescibacterota bacterium]